MITLPDASVSIRAYVPEVAPPAEGRPALLDIHGGGFCVGSIEMEHGFATQVARELDTVVVAVEYRLAPEHPFPAGLEDCYAALQSMHHEAAVLGVDPGRIGVGGQSAGGGLTAATVLLARSTEVGRPCASSSSEYPSWTTGSRPRREHEDIRRHTDVEPPRRGDQLAVLPRPQCGHRVAVCVAHACPRPPWASARIRHHDGVRPSTRRRHHVRTAHDGGGRVWVELQNLPWHLPWVGSCSDRPPLRRCCRPRTADCASAGTEGRPLDLMHG